MFLIRKPIYLVLLLLPFAGSTEELSEEQVFQNGIQTIFNSDTGRVYSVTKSTIPDYFEIHLTNGRTVLMDKDKTNIIVSVNGGIEEISIKEKINTTRQNKALLASRFTDNHSPVVSYKSENEQYKLNVFADIQCGYCQLFHGEIKELNTQGVSVDIYPVPTYDQSDLYMTAAYCSQEPNITYDNLTNKLINNSQHAKDKSKGDREAYIEIAQQGLDDIKAESKAIIDASECYYDMTNAKAHTQAFGIYGTPAFLFDDKTLVLGNLSQLEIINKLKGINNAN